MRAQKVPLFFEIGIQTTQGLLLRTLCAKLPCTKAMTVADSQQSLLEMFVASLRLSGARITSDGSEHTTIFNQN